MTKINIKKRSYWREFYNDNNPKISYFIELNEDSHKSEFCFGFQTLDQNKKFNYDKSMYIIIRDLPTDSDFLKISRKGYYEVGEEIISIAICNIEIYLSDKPVIYSLHFNPGNVGDTTYFLGEEKQIKEIKVTKLKFSNKNKFEYFFYVETGNEVKYSLIENLNLLF